MKMMRVIVLVTFLLLLRQNIQNPKLRKKGFLEFTVCVDFSPYLADSKVGGLAQEQQFRAKKTSKAVRATRDGASLFSSLMS